MTIDEFRERIGTIVFHADLPATDIVAALEEIAQDLLTRTADEAYAAKIATVGDIGDD